MLITSSQHSCVQGPLWARECRSIRSGASRLPYYCTPLEPASRAFGVQVEFVLTVVFWIHKPASGAFGVQITNSCRRRNTGFRVLQQQKKKKIRSSSKHHACVQGPLRAWECRSIQSDASGLPWYWTPLVCVPAVIGAIAVWRQNTPKKKLIRGSGDGNFSKCQAVSSKKRTSRNTERLILQGFFFCSTCGILETSKLFPKT